MTSDLDRFGSRTLVIVGCAQGNSKSKKLMANTTIAHVADRIIPHC